MLRFIKKTVKATILNLIVALLISIIVIATVCFFFGAKIATTVSLVSKISIKIDENKDVKPIQLVENEGIINYPNYGTQYATIEIPRIDVNLPVFFGDTLDILKSGVGHSTGSYFPGEGGSIIYMGHNSKNVFRRFSELQVNDKIIVKTDYGTFNYNIYNMQIVKETEIDKTPIQSDEEILMVYTCYPFNNIGYATQRYVVYAKLEK